MPLQRETVSVPKRQYYLDRLRFFVIMLLVPFHASLTFTKNGDVYLYDYSLSPPTGMLLFDIFAAIWMMPLLFFISGMASWYGLAKRSNKSYLAERVFKLLFPTPLGDPYHLYCSSLFQKHISCRF